MVPYRPFRDRRDAGRILAGLLDEYRDRSDVIVLGLPRGACRAGRSWRWAPSPAAG